jgi:hypothetical protein
MVLVPGKFVVYTYAHVHVCARERMIERERQKEGMPVGGQCSPSPSRLLPAYIPELDIQQRCFKEWRLAFDVYDLLYVGAILYSGLGLNIEAL